MARTAPLKLAVKNVVNSSERPRKYVKENEVVGIDDLERWGSGSDAVGFLSVAAATPSAQELLKYPLLIRPWRKESLIGLVDLGLICLRGHYKYTPSAETVHI
ncbi:hypothetical protein CLCR_11322 [Cladophialophora carrionii]|uniref:Uncharacterized protein n=1 Tax=Cladophialophora carrionii TaxID=86049 RepID=A0A1C1CKK5_9EURO|nr:hypothetical protein CLCR_11322 [Cladophialophora carrionii]